MGVREEDEGVNAETIILISDCVFLFNIYFFVLLSTCPSFQTSEL